MNVGTTGGAGFLGSHVARELLEAGTLCDSSGVRRTLRTLTVVDLVAPRQTWASDPRVRVVIGDIADNELIQRIITADCDSVFHFAAILKADADRDAQAAVRFNVLGMVSLLEHCRSLGSKLSSFSQVRVASMKMASASLGMKQGIFRRARMGRTRQSVSFWSTISPGTGRLTDAACGIP